MNRLALTIDEAAESLGMSRPSFLRLVLPGVRVVYVGRKRIVPVRELEAWLDREATRMGAA